MEHQLLATPLLNNVLAPIAPKVDPQSVRCYGRTVELVIGNGLVTTEYATDFIVQAQQEVLLSTCFWAPSSSLVQLHNVLITLNARAKQDGRRVSVRILFSSYSLAQKFLSFKGVRIWRSKTWKRLGLPSTDTLECLDMTVLSRFKKPFGVMHAKFVIIDRQIVILPSSNISCTILRIHLTEGENWYELAVRLEGEIVHYFVQYFFRYYHPTGASVPQSATSSQPIYPSSIFREKYPDLLYSFESPQLPLAFLPSAPSRVGTFPFSPVHSPTTLFQVQAIIQARRTIFIQTPNLTSRAILKAIKRALRNGIHVTLYLPRYMMVLESLVTGWTTTQCSVRWLLSWTRRHPETHLMLEWFQCDPYQAFPVDGEKTHIKFMVVDEELVIVGSSNLDRASACTSGEVDVAFVDADLAWGILSAIKAHQRTGKSDI